MSAAACGVRSHRKRILGSIVGPSPTGDAGRTLWLAADEVTELVQERPVPAAADTSPAEALAAAIAPMATADRDHNSGPARQGF
jgi:hypothetical protein